jgi:hypothetical protein
MPKRKRSRPPRDPRKGGRRAPLPERWPGEGAVRLTWVLASQALAAPFEQALALGGARTPESEALVRAAMEFRDTARKLLPPVVVDQLVAHARQHGA